MGNGLQLLSGMSVAVSVHVVIANSCSVSRTQVLHG